MFLHVFVCPHGCLLLEGGLPLEGGGGLSLEGGGLPLEGGGLSLEGGGLPLERGGLPLEEGLPMEGLPGGGLQGRGLHGGAWYAWRRVPRETVNQRSVRILLECILVGKKLVIFPPVR